MLTAFRTASVLDCVVACMPVTVCCRLLACISSKQCMQAELKASTPACHHGLNLAATSLVHGCIITPNMHKDGQPSAMLLIKCSLQRSQSST